MSEREKQEKLRSIGEGLRTTAAEGKNTIISPSAAETFAQALILAAEILEEWKRRDTLKDTTP